MLNDISEQPRLLASALQTHMSPGSPLDEAVRAELPDERLELLGFSPLRPCFQPPARSTPQTSQSA